LTYDPLPSGDKSCYCASTISETWEGWSSDYIEAETEYILSYDSSDEATTSFDDFANENNFLIGYCPTVGQNAVLSNIKAEYILDEHIATYGLS
jgi:hypothetical protein